MKTLKMLGLGAAAVIGLAGVANAEDYGTHDATKPDASKTQTALPGAVNEQVMTVKIQKIDKANNKIWFETELAEVANKAQLDRLKPGDEVRASFDPATGEVVKIELSRTPADSMDKPSTPATPDSTQDPLKPDDGM